MASIDRDAQERFSIPGIVLMEGAALRCFDLLKVHARNLGEARARLVFAAGRGNNGGDALAMARLARIDGHFDVHVVLSHGEPTGQCGQQLAACRALGIPVLLYEDAAEECRNLFAAASWIVDGLSGTGIRGSLRQPVAEIVNAVNAAGRPVFAVDTPSGIGDSFRENYPAVRATITATVGLPKICLYLPRARPFCGTIIHVPISFPSELTEAPDIPGEIMSPEELSSLLPAIAPWTYKNRRGYLGVFAGNTGTSGAALLAATAGARTRTGLVSLHIDREVYGAVAASCRSVMARPWSGPDDPANTLPGPYTAILAGPGWGRDEDRSRWLEAIIATGLPGVLDADALNLLGEWGEERRKAVDFGGRWVFTPHPGEFARLWSAVHGSTADSPRDQLLDNPVPAVLSLAADFRAVIVLKGHVTTIAAPDGRFWMVDGMNPAMATGGSGDVLSGIIAGLIASGLPAEDAARAGVLLHLETGREVFEKMGWFISEDLLDYLSPVLSRYQRQE